MGQSDRGAVENGFIVIAVLWILAALATLASIYAVYVAESAISQSANYDWIRAGALASAGLELTAYQLSAPAKTGRPTRGAFTFRLGQSTVAVSFLSEAARIDLNAAPKEILAGLFVVLGARQEQADQYADRIIGWRTALKAEEQSQEESLYRSAGLRYLPRGAPFAHINELWLVPGLPPSLIERAMPYITIFSGQPQVNVIDAPPEVIASLPGMSPERVRAFVSQRNSLQSDPQLVLSALGAAQSGATTAASDAYRVRIRVNFDNGARFDTEAVILPGNGDEPFGVLSWRDDSDLSLTSSATTARQDRIAK